MCLAANFGPFVYLVSNWHGNHLNKRAARTPAKPHPEAQSLFQGGCPTEAASPRTLNDAFDNDFKPLQNVDVQRAQLRLKLCGTTRPENYSCRSSHAYYLANPATSSHRLYMSWGSGNDNTPRITPSSHAFGGKMVALPLFKLASLFVRHVSKYGAVRLRFALLRKLEQPG